MRLRAPHPEPRRTRCARHARVRAAAVAATLVLAAVLAALPVAAQDFAFAEKASLELVPDRTAYLPGETVRLQAVVTVEDGWHVNSHTPTYDYLIATELRLDLPAGLGEPRITYPPHAMQQFEFTEEPIAVYDGTVTITAELTLPADVAGPVPVAAHLRYQACDHESCLPPVTVDATVDLTIGAGGEPTAAAVGAAAPPAAAGIAGTSLLWMLLLGFVGGVILNAMPCVLPVLSLKLFGLVKSAGDGRAAVVRGGLATTAGVLVSFWALAAMVVTARAAGDAVGWGVQFQQPGFVAFLAVVMVLFALNMWGLFEVPLPQTLARAGSAHGHEGLAGHFVAGLFATLLATPCSAPFLGTAVGFALAQPATTIVGVFTAVGLGLALPYLLLAAYPASTRWLPRPGAWMLTLKGVMGFLLAGAAVWLFYVLAAQIAPEHVAFVQLLLLMVALVVWLGSRAASPAARRSAVLATVLLSVATVAVAAAAPATPADGGADTSRLGWIAFDESEARRLADEEGRLVFVDVTADWCLTCKATERLVLETDSTATLFAEHQVVAMKADWTNRDDAITDFLARFGRSAVPFYVLYRPAAEPHAFGELLTARRLETAVRDASRLARRTGAPRAATTASLP